MVMVSRSSLVLILLAGTGACHRADYGADGGAIECTVDLEACPAGTTCHLGFCLADGSALDAGLGVDASQSSDGGEVAADGGRVSGDAGRTRCGDGITNWESGESCDDGDALNGDHNKCKSDCTDNGCGDGFPCIHDNCCDDYFQPCDDGNAQNNDRCDNECRWNLELPLECHDNRVESDSWITGDRMFWLCHVDRNEFRKTWAQWSEQCEAWGGYLATVSNDAEAQAIRQAGNAHGRPHTYYLGGQYQDDEWGWANGEPITWQPPAAGNGQCLWMQGDFAGTSCENSIGAYCEFGPHLTE